MILSIVTVQRGLKALGMDPGAIDGVYGKNTAQALKTFMDSVTPGNGQAIDKRFTVKGSNIAFKSPSVAQVLQEAAAGGQPLPQGAATPPATPSPTSRSVQSRRAAPSTASMVPAVGKDPFFRRDNPWAWIVAAIGIAAVTGGGYYIYQRTQ